MLRDVDVSLGRGRGFRRVVPVLEGEVRDIEEADDLEGFKTLGGALLWALEAEGLLNGEAIQGLRGPDRPQGSVSDRGLTRTVKADDLRRGNSVSRR